MPKLNAAFILRCSSFLAVLANTGLEDLDSLRELGLDLSSATSLAIIFGLVDAVANFALQGDVISNGSMKKRMVKNQEEAAVETRVSLPKKFLSYSLQFVNTFATAFNTAFDRYFLIGAFSQCLEQIIADLSESPAPITDIFDRYPLLWGVWSVSSIIGFFGKLSIDNYAANRQIAKKIEGEDALPIQASLLRRLYSTALFTEFMGRVYCAESMLVDDTLACFLLPSSLIDGLKLSLGNRVSALIQATAGSGLTLVALPISLVQSLRFDFLAFKVHRDHACDAPRFDEPNEPIEELSYSSSGDLTRSTSPSSETSDAAIEAGEDIPLVPSLKSSVVAQPDPEIKKPCCRKRNAWFGFFTTGSVLRGINLAVPAVLALLSVIEGENGELSDMARYALFGTLSLALLLIGFLSNQLSEVKEAMDSIDAHDRPRIRAMEV